MKKIVSMMLILSLLATSMISMTGCADKNIEIMTKGQWIQKLASSLGLDECVSTEPTFSTVNSESEYFVPVQACAEWDILDKKEDFDPNSEATIDYAITTAVKAIGVESIATSTYNKVLQTSDDFVQFYNDNSDMDYISGGALYSEWADNVVDDMNKIKANLEMKQSCEIQKKDGVIEVSAEDIEFHLDQETADIVGGNMAAKEGDVLLIQPSEMYPEGKVIKVTAVNGNKINYINASAEDAITNVKVSGTYKPRILGVIPASKDVQVVSVGGNADIRQQDVYLSDSTASQLMYVPNVNVEATQLANYSSSKSLDDIVFNIGNISGNASGEKNVQKNFDNGSQVGGNMSGKAAGSASAKVGIRNMSVTTDIDTSWLKVKKADFRVNAELFAHVAAEGSASAVIPLATIPCEICPGITVVIQAALVLGANGKVDIDWSMKNTVGIVYKSGASAQFIKDMGKPNTTIDLSAELYALPSMKGTVKALGFSVASVGIESGIKVNAKGHGETNTKVMCIDLKAYAPLSVFVGGEDKETLLAKLGAKKKFVIWDENKSGFNKEFHLENFKRVDKCTNPKDDEIEPMEFEKVKVIDIKDIKFPDFSCFESGFFSVANSFYTVSAGACEKIKVNGYKNSDLIFTSSDSSIVSVSGDGMISGNTAGVANVEIKSKSGDKSQMITVIVKGTDGPVQIDPVKPVEGLSCKKGLNNIQLSDVA